MANRDDIRDRVMRQVGDRSKRFVTEDDLDVWFQDGLAEIARRTNYHKKIYQTDIVSGQDDYDISELHITQLDRVLYLDGSTYKTICEIPYSEWQERRESMDTTTGTNSTGTPTGYILNGDYLFLDPCPDGAVSDGLRLWVSRVEVVSDDTTEISMPRAFQDCLVFYMAYRWQQKARAAQGAGRFLEGFWQEFERRTREFKHHIAAQKGRGKVMLRSPEQEDIRGFM